MELLASAFALEKTPEQLRREAEEEQQRQEAAAEKRRRQEAKAAEKLERVLSMDDSDGAGTQRCSDAAAPSSSPSAAQQGSPQSDGGQAVRPPRTRIRITPPTVSPTPAARKGSVDRGMDPLPPDDLLLQRTMEWELARVALEGRIQQQATEVAALQTDLVRAHDKISELQAAQHGSLDPLEEAVEFQQKLDALRADLARDKRLLHQRQQERESQLRQEFEQERQVLQSAHWEELEDQHQALDQQLRDAQARHQQALAEKEQLIDSLRSQLRTLRSEVARLTAMQPPPVRRDAGPSNSHGGRWEKDIITDAKRASSRRYDVLGLQEVDRTPDEEIDAMKVYLKNLVINMLCEKDDAVKATLVPSLAELLGCSAEETQFIYHCHPEWRPDTAQHNPSTLGSVLSALFGS